MQEIKLRMQKSEREQDKARSDRGGSDVLPPSIKSGTHQKQTAENPQSNTSKSHGKIKCSLKAVWKVAWNYLQKLFSAGPDRHIELLLTIVIAVYAYRQYEVYKWQRARDITANRPIVAPYSVSLYRHLDKSYALRFEWKDVGATPTSDLEVWWTQQEEIPDAPASISYKRHVSGGVGPNTSEYDFLPIDESELVKLQENKGHLFVLAKMTYKDLFPDNDRSVHLSRYCTVISEVQPNPVLKNGDFWIGHAELCSLGREFDCRDEECGKEYYRLNSKNPAP
jgi:hypothetical protein